MVDCQQVAVFQAHIQDVLFHVWAMVMFFITACSAEKQFIDAFTSHVSASLWIFLESRLTGVNVSVKWAGPDFGADLCSNGTEVLVGDAPCGATNTETRTKETPI